MNASRKKILLVDDDPNITEFLSRCLRAAGYVTCVQNDPTRALRAVRNFKPDLAVLDIDMPKMDGGDVMRQFKEHEESSEIPIIFLSGLATMADQNIRPEDSMEKVLAKPVSLRTLLDCIDSLCAQPA